MTQKSPFSSSSHGRTSSHHIPILETRDFPGTYSFPKPQQIPRGAAQASLDFLTRDTWVELRPGYHPLGTENDAAGAVLGIKTVHRWDGSEVIFRATKDGKLTYYDPADASGVAVNGWSEVGGVGANILTGAAAAGESVYIDEYNSPAGAQTWVSSPSSDLIKIMTANPSSYLSQYNVSKNFKGRIRVIQNSLFLWHYKVGFAPASNAILQRSYIDSQAYTTKSGEAQSVTTASPNVTFTLASQTGVLTSFGIVVHYADSSGSYTETFVDDYLGNLNGSNGGTGTVNYSTGAVSVKPHQAPTGTITVTADYQLEDSTAGGIADFTKSGTRLAGQGVAFIQISGGDILGVNPYSGSYYVLHQKNAWVVTPSADDSSATNIIYRDNIALASERGSVATADGVYYIDDHGRNVTDQDDVSRPYIALIEYNPLASQVLPVDLSSHILDLSSYVFDQCFSIQALDWILFFCRTSDSPVNNRAVAYNYKLSTSKRRIFDILSYSGNCATTYASQVVAGDSITNTAFKLFDGFDDDGSVIQNAAWIGNQDDHGVEGLKKTKRIWVEGFIGVNQSTDVYVALDAGSAIKVGTISGSGSYVDQGQAVTIGSLQIGVYPIGGPSSQPVAYHYLVEIKLNSAKYKYFTISFLPTAIGYFSFQMYANYDIRLNVDKLPRKYRAANVAQALSAGSGGGGSGGITPYNLFYTETPQGAVDGVNKTYTLLHAVHTVFSFEINGELIDSGQYAISGNTITFSTPLPASLSGTAFEVVYQ